MKKNSSDTTATFSMIVASLIVTARERKEMSLQAFLEAIEMSQSSWSRITRGQSFFTLEELRASCRVLELTMSDVIRDAENASIKLTKHEDIQILDERKASNRKAIATAVIAVAALGFLISRLSR